MTVSVSLRSDLGRPLHSTEVDANFVTLRDAVNDFVAPAGVGITSFSVSGNLLTIHMTDGSTHGPFQLPVAALHWTDLYIADHTYQELDLFQVEGRGVYLVLGDYTSPSDTTEGSGFDPDVSDTSGPLLQLMFGIPAAPALPLNSESGDFTLASGHMGAYTRVDSATDVNVTVPLAADWAPGAIAKFRQVGVGQIIFVPETTTEDAVSITTAETLKTRRDGSTVTIIYADGVTYDLAGDLEAAP